MAMPAKKACAVTRSEFQQHARAVQVKIGDLAVEAVPKQFSPGSFGFFAQQKVPVVINGKTVMCALQIQMPVVGSKELPSE